MANGLSASGALTLWVARADLYASVPAPLPRKAGLSGVPLVGLWFVPNSEQGRAGAPTLLGKEANKSWRYGPGRLDRGRR
jgi:hypothetical protein